MQRNPSYEHSDQKLQEEKVISIAIPFKALNFAKKGDFSMVEHFGKFKLDSIQFYAASRQQLLKSQLIHRGMSSIKICIKKML